MAALGLKELMGMVLLLDMDIDMDMDMVIVGLLPEPALPAPAPESWLQREKAEFLRPWWWCGEW